MKKITLSFIVLAIVSSCYTYKTYDPEEEAKETATAIESTKLTSVRGNSNSKNNSNANGVNKVASVESITPKTIIKEKGYYQLEVFEREYKIEAVKWEGDTLIAHKKGNPKKEYKFNEKDIQYLKVRKFSKGRSDALTVAAYVAGGVAVYLLVR